MTVSFFSFCHGVRPRVDQSRFPGRNLFGRSDKKVADIFFGGIGALASVGGRSTHVEALQERLAGRRAVWICNHELGHVGPPALADIGLGDCIPAILVLDFRIAKEIVGFGIQVDRVVRDAVLAQGGLEFWPNRIVAAGVFLSRAWLDFQEKSFAGFNRIAHKI